MMHKLTNLEVNGWAAMAVLVLIAAVYTVLLPLALISSINTLAEMGGSSFHIELGWRSWVAAMFIVAFFSQITFVNFSDKE